MGSHSGGQRTRPSLQVFSDFEGGKFFPVKLENLCRAARLKCGSASAVMGSRHGASPAAALQGSISMRRVPPSRPAPHGLSLDLETDFHRDLKLFDLAVLDPRALAGHFKPVYVTDGFGRFLDRGPGRFRKADG